MDGQVRASYAILVCAVLLAASAFLPWATVRVGERSVAYAPADLPLGLALLAGVVAVLVGTALAALSGSRAGLATGAAVGAALTVVVGVHVVGTEVLAALVPADLLPLTARRMTLATGAGPGAWLALCAGAATMLAAAADGPGRIAAGLRAVRGGGVAASVAIATIAAGALALIQLRQGAWLYATVPGSALSVDGLALPWIAPATFAAVWLLAAGAVLACLGRRQLASLVAAGTGWLVCTCATATAAGAGALAGVQVTAAHATPAVWLTFAVGVSAAAASAVLLWQGEVAR